MQSLRIFGGSDLCGEKLSEHDGGVLSGLLGTAIGFAKERELVEKQFQFDQQPLVKVTLGAHRFEAPVLGKELVEVRADFVWSYRVEAEFEKEVDEVFVLLQFIEQLVDAAFVEVHAELVGEQLGVEMTGFQVCAPIALVGLVDDLQLGMFFCACVEPVKKGFIGLHRFSQSSDWEGIEGYVEIGAEAEEPAAQFTGAAVEPFPG